MLDEEKIISFGKYKGKTVGWLMKTNPKYFNWAKENVPNMIYSKRVNTEEDELKKEISDNIWIKNMFKLHQNNNFLNEKN